MMRFKTLAIFIIKPFTVTVNLQDCLEQMMSRMKMSDTYCLK